MRVTPASGDPIFIYTRTPDSWIAPLQPFGETGFG
jgi:hypothetical protein